MKPRIEHLQSSAPGNNRPMRTIRTFLAEDSPVLMALLARIVSKDKRVAIVGSASDGRKALCNASTLGPDLVVTDLHMPGLNGPEVTRRLRQLDQNPGVPQRACAITVHPQEFIHRFHVPPIFAESANPPLDGRFRLFDALGFGDLLIAFSAGNRERKRLKLGLL